MSPRPPPFRTQLLAALTLALACRSRAAPPPTPARGASTVPGAAKPAAAPPTTAAAHPAASATTADAATAARVRRTRVVHAAPTGEHPVSELVPTPEGAALVWVQPATDHRHETLMAQRFDADGRESGPPRVLRVTTGPVVALSADALGDALWVAWIAAPVRATATGDGGAASGDTAGGGERLVVALRAHADLSAVDPPVTVEDFALHGGADSPWDGDHAEVVALDEGRGAAVVYTGGTTTCVYQVSEDAPVQRDPCARYALGLVDPTGHVRHANSTPVLAAAEEPHSLIRLPSHVSWLVGDVYLTSKTGVEVLPIAAGADAAPHWAVSLMGYLGANTAFTGDRVVYTLGATSDIDPEGGDNEGRTATHVVVERLDGTADTSHTERDGLDYYPRLEAMRARCNAGRLTVQLAWHGGAVELDPRREGASFRLGAFLPRSALGASPPTGPMAWAGRALLVLDEQGAAHRYVCDARGHLAPAPLH